MVQEKKTFKEWCKEHEKELMIAGSAIVVAGIAVAGYILVGENSLSVSSSSKIISLDVNEIKKVDKTKEILETVVDGISDSSKEVGHRIPHDVSGHVRNLPEGFHASFEKIEEAKKAGIMLLDGQTYINPYSTGGCKVA